LQPSEQGFLHVENLKMNGQNCQAKEVETILEVTLPAAIKP
jgi:hypothetical protein